MNSEQFQRRVVRIPTLLQELENGKWFIPSYTKDYQWSSGIKVEMLNKIKHGMPLGQIVTWRTCEQVVEGVTGQCPVSDEIGVGPYGERKEDEVQDYVIGHERQFVTLYETLWLDTGNDIYINLENENLMPWGYLDENNRNELKWFNLKHVFDPSKRADYEMKIQQSSDNKPHRETMLDHFDQLQCVLKDYTLSVVQVCCEDKEMVMEEVFQSNV